MRTGRLDHIGLVLRPAALWCSLAFVALAVSPLAAKEKEDESDEWFKSGRIPKLKIEVEPAEVERIGGENRPYVRAKVTEDDETTYKNVSIKLKGSAGSFRDFSDKPALTLKIDASGKKAPFHGLRKFQLNNSVQDESYLNELICSEIFRAAGYPAPRVTHARVWLNGRDVGLYVLKEGFDARFLGRHFRRSEGNLYDGGFVQDIDANLVKDTGDGPNDRGDLYALALAAREPDPVKRWSEMGKRLDIDTFLTFMALERMTCHWDGYTMNVNNYRIYFDPERDGRAVFLPHGMDQMFGDPGMGLFEESKSMISSAVVQSNAGWKEYRKRIHGLVPIFSPADRWIARVDEVAGRLQPLLREIGEKEAEGFRDRVRELKERLAQRADNLKEQDKQPDPEFLAFDDKGYAKLADWYTASESEGVKHEEIDLDEGRRGYRIDAGPNGQCVASWRCRVLLGPGSYQLNARCRAVGVTPLDGNCSSGVGVRISHSERMTGLWCTTKSVPTTYTFTVAEDRREVELVLELKARRGEAIFEADSLNLLRLPPGTTTPSQM